MPPAITRITGYPVRNPVPMERVNCPQFADHMLQRGGPGGSYGGSVFFGDVPFLVVKVETDGGPAGWGDSTRGIDEALFRQSARQLLGLTLDDIAADRPMLDVSEFVAAENRLGRQHVHPYKCLETAALDWKARCLELPLWRMFGRQVRDAVRVEYWSGFRTPEGAKAVARQGVARGHLGLKLKADLTVDIAGVTQAVFDAAGPNFQLNIDPNGQWPTFADALSRARAMRAVSANVLLEDPVYGNYEMCAQLRQQANITLGVTVTQADWVRQAHALRATDSFNLGGTWHQLLQSAALVEELGYPFWLGSGLECSFSDLASIHFACTRPGCTIGNDLIAHLMRADDLLTQPVAYRHGCAIVPERPGMGYEIDLDALERCRVGDPIVVA